VRKSTDKYTTGHQQWPAMSKNTSGFLETCGGSNQVGCSVYPGVFHGSSDNGRGLNDVVPEAFADGFGPARVESESGRIGRTRSRSTSRADSTTVRINNRQEGSLERKLHRQRSRSLQVRTPSSARRDLSSSVHRVNNDQDFMLPQYIGNMYAKNKPTSGDHMSLQSGFLADADSTSDLHFVRHHTRFLPHGIVWTALAIVISWGGLGLAFLTRKSLKFVRLEEPWQIGAIYNEVYSLGVIHVSICYNETMSTIEDPTRVGCFSVPLATNDDLDDPILKLTAVFASVSVMVGFILTLAMTTTLCWRTINFKAVGTGYLFAYCFQALSFLFFDTDICEDNKCKMDIGCVYCIAASLLWVCGCMLCAKMESNRVRFDLAEERKRRKNAVANEFVRKQSIVLRSGATVITERTTSTTSDERSLDLDEESTIGGSKERNKMDKKAHSTDDFALFDDLTSERMEKPRRKTINGTERQHDSPFKRPSSSRLAVGKSGIERQRDSIVKLDPPVRSAWYFAEGYTTISALAPSPSSRDDIRSNPDRGRVEYEGNALPVRRGRIRSERRSSNGHRRVNDNRRSESRGRSRSAITRHRSNSATLRHRSKSATSRGRSHSKSRSISANSMHIKTATRHGEKPAQIDWQVKRLALTRDAMPTHSGVTGYASIPKSPRPDPFSPTKIDFVTSYFDI
jgi:hypothetical protein